MVLAAARAGQAFDSHCGIGTAECADGVAAARERWGVGPNAASIDERSEHARLWVETFEASGLPAALLEDLVLPVFTSDEVVAGHPTVRPVLSGATRRVLRVTSPADLTQLPDFSYTLWDWATGNETCPPGPLNPEVCHEYFPHIGMLNSNHMVPQAERFYRHYHRLALQRAADCRTLFDDLPGEHGERFRPFVLACEKEALALEAVGQHFLQDAWSMGHMWERWGGTEFTDFGSPPLGDRTLGAAVAAYTGIIHGGRAMLGEGFDDPMCAPHPGVGYIDGTSAGTERLGLGDVFLDEVLLPASGDSPYVAQRRAVFGCAVDGMRTVYEQTAQVHGQLAPPEATKIDSTRRAAEASCWGQRATNQALAIGFGLHVGTFPNQVPLLEVYPGLADPGVTNESFPAGILAFALSTFSPAVGLPPFSDEQAERFALDAAAAATEAAAKGADPATALDTDLASGRLPAIAGIRPNSHYARGSETEPPSTYADPFLPWTVFDGDPDLEERTRALNLVFADAHAADRCGELSEIDLLAYRALSEEAVGGDPALEEARCGQCEQMVAPHLRFGLPVAHDERREAFCAFAGPSDATFVYTEEDPADFTGFEPTDLTSLRNATRQWCGCEVTTTTTTSTTTTTLPAFVRVVECSFSARASSDVAIPDFATGDSCFDVADSAQGSAPLPSPGVADSATCTIEVSAGGNTASGSGRGTFDVSLSGAQAVPGTAFFDASGLTVSVTGNATTGGGGSAIRQASGTGGGSVRCVFEVSGTVAFDASAVGSTPAGSFSNLDVEFRRLSPLVTLGFFRHEAGEGIGNFPVSGTLTAGFYEVDVDGGAEANLVRLSSATTTASFILTVAPAP
jgi:hypothetical protein